VFFCAVYGVLYRSVCVGNGGMCSPGCGRAVCKGGVCVVGGVCSGGVCVVEGCV